MKLYKIFTNRKGDMPWHLITWILAIAIFLFISFMIIATRKEMSSNILAIFKRW